MLDYLQQTKPFGCEVNKNSSYVVIGIPLDNTASYRPGTRFAPLCIREASCNIEFYSLYGDVDVDEILYNDLGDIPIVIGDNILSFKLIKNILTDIYTKEKIYEKILFILGGEHTITYPVLESIREINQQDIGYIVFDAHLDLRNEYLGYRFGHASTNRLIFEELDIKPLIIGARAFSKQELDYARKNNIKFFTPLDPLDKILDNVSDYISTTKNVYISIDMDSIDPGFAPGVSNPEPLGLKPFDLLNIIKHIINNGAKIKAVDIVETNPLYDKDHITCVLAAKLIVEITGMIEARTKWL